MTSLDSSLIQRYVQLLDNLRNYVYYGLFGGKRIIKAAHLANIFKGSTFIYLLILMIYYENYSLMAISYLFMHGSYGFLWIYKYFAFPDKSFEQYMTLSSAIGGSILLSLYNYIDYLAISINKEEQNNCSMSRILICMTMYLIGVFLMLLSDYQKNSILK